MELLHYSVLIKQTCIFCGGLRQVFQNERQGPSFLIYELLLNRFPNLYICCKIDPYFHYELFLHVELAGSWLKFGSYILDRIYLWFYCELISCGLLRCVFGEHRSYISGSCTVYIMNCFPQWVHGSFCTSVKWLC